jgi:alginate O-acetyltransferase complex protein AlgI
MVFTSESFLFLFLPAFLAVYYLAPAGRRSIVILAGSYLFYGWWRFDYLALLFGTTLWAYIFGRLIARDLGQVRGRARLWLLIGVGGCLCVLGVFKYLNFFVDSFAALFGTDAAGLGFHWQLLLPIGISFYVFQAISYLMDVYRRDAEATESFFDFAAFIALFPQLIAGPILRFKDLADQFVYREHSLQKFADGMALFTVGLAKKVILADSVAPLADLAFSADNPSLLLSWLGAIAYMLQLYFDFSGYSDMALGLGLMLGFHFNKNFDTPYVSASITEFWRRWHISLSIWLRDYLYIPLGGNRKGPVRTYINLMLVMVLGGLWHGANWTFVFWGMWHGAWLAIERATGLSDGRGVAAHLRTLLIVLVGWVAFRSSDMAQTVDMWSGMVGVHGFAIGYEALSQISRESLVLLALAILVAAFEPQLNTLARRMYYPGDSYIAATSLPAGPLPAPPMTATTTLLPVAALCLTGLLILVLLRLAEQSFSPFLYFQF